MLLYLKNSPSRFITIVTSKFYQLIELIPVWVESSHRHNLVYSLMSVGEIA